MWHHSSLHCNENKFEIRRYVITVTWSLKDQRNENKKHLQWNHEYQRYVIDFFIFLKPKSLYLF